MKPRKHHLRIRSATPLFEVSKRSFINTVLGETWAETGEAADWQRLYERREDFRRGTVRACCSPPVPTCRKDRIEVSIWAWGRSLGSWLIDYVVIEGGPERSEAWATLTELLARPGLLGG